MAMAETSLQPPDEAYGEYATANGFEGSKDGTDTPLRETPPELEEMAVLDATAADALTDTVGS